MRVALVQMRISPSRSANLSAAMSHVRAAARRQPAPDLIVLPGVCDGLDVDRVATAAAQCFHEALAVQAREWGLFIAAGLAGLSDGGVGRMATLLDADGDCIGETYATESGAPMVVAETCMGNIALGFDGPGMPVGPVFGSVDLIVVCGCWTAPTRSAAKAKADVCDRLRKIAEGSGVAVCAAGACGGPETKLIPWTAHIGADGAVVAEVPADAETILHAEIPIGLGV